MNRREFVVGAVTLPLALPGIIAGMVLCFAKALGEFGATITFVSNIPGETETLPLAMARQAHACTHTTFAPTIIHGGTKTNVIPDLVDVEDR